MKQSSTPEGAKVNVILYLMRVKLPSLTPGLEETRSEATEGRDKNDNDNDNEDEDENSHPPCPPETGATSAKHGGGG